MKKASSWSLVFGLIPVFTFFRNCSDIERCRIVIHCKLYVRSSRRVGDISKLVSLSLYISVSHPSSVQQTWHMWREFRVFILLDWISPTFCRNDACVHYTDMGVLETFFLRELIRGLRMRCLSTLSTLVQYQNWSPRGTLVTAWRNSMFSANRVLKFCSV